MSPQVNATSSESKSEADSEACSSVISEAEKFSGAVIVGNVKSGKYHRADEDHPELVLPACMQGRYIMNVLMPRTSLSEGSLDLLSLLRPQIVPWRRHEIFSCVTTFVGSYKMDPSAFGGARNYILVAPLFTIAGSMVQRNQNLHDH